MNPLTYKAHPLLSRWVDLLHEPSAHHLSDILYLLGILFAGNILLTAGLPWLLRKAESLELSSIKAYFFALPATWLYLPFMLTLLQDVIRHSFELQHRWFLLFALLVVSQFLTALYAFALRHERSGLPIGLESGLTVSLFLLLASIPASLIMIGINAFKPFM
jgi:hypothetical protein